MTTKLTDFRNGSKIRNEINTNRSIFDDPWKTSIFTNMKNIRKFSIKNNRLSWIPSAFTSKLLSATDINLSHNQLKIFKVILWTLNYCVNLCEGPQTKSDMNKSCLTDFKFCIQSVIYDFFSNVRAVLEKLI